MKALNTIVGALGFMIPMALAGTSASAEDQLKEGLDIAAELIERVRPAVQGLKVSAPLGQVDLLEDLLHQSKGGMA